MGRNPRSLQESVFGIAQVRQALPEFRLGTDVTPIVLFITTNTASVLSPFHSTRAEPVSEPPLLRWRFNPLDEPSGVLLTELKLPLPAPWTVPPHPISGLLVSQSPPTSEHPSLCSCTSPGVQNTDRWIPLSLPAYDTSRVEDLS